MIANEQVLCLIGTPQQVVETLRLLGLQVGQVVGGPGEAKAPAEQPSACEKGSQAEKAMESFAEIQQVGCQHFDISEGEVELLVEMQQEVISACEKGEVEKALGLFAGLQQSGLVPNVDFYTALIRACDKGNKAERAELLSEVQQIGLTCGNLSHKVEKARERYAETEACEALDSACEKGGKSAEQSAERPLPQEEPEVTCSAPSSACEKGHIAEQTNDLVANMQWAGWEPSVITAELQQSACKNGHQAVISACEKGHKKYKKKEEKGQQALGLQAVQQQADVKRGEKGMQQRNLKPEAITYTGPISACVEMQQLGRKGHEVPTEAVPALISACQNGQAEKAIELFCGMWTRGWTPDAVTYNSLISACEKGHKEEGQTPALMIAQQLGLIPTVDIERAMGLFAWMQRRGLEPNVTSHTVLISACVKGHEVEQLMGMFVEMQQGSITPDHIHALAVRRRKGHNIENALNLFRDMQLGAGV